MKCHQAQMKLSERWGELLTTEERARLAEHLAGCARCRAVAEDLRYAVTALGELSAPRTSEQFLARLRAALPPSRWPWWRVGFRARYGMAPSYGARRLALAGATTLTLLLGGSTGLIHHRRAQQQAQDYLALCAERHELIAMRIDALTAAPEDERERLFDEPGLLR